MQAGQRGSGSPLTPSISVVPHWAPPCQLARAERRARSTRVNLRDAGSWHSSIDLYGRGTAERRGPLRSTRGEGLGPRRTAAPVLRAGPSGSGSGFCRRSRPDGQRRTPSRKPGCEPSAPAAPSASRARGQAPLGGGRGLGRAPGGQGGPGGRAGPSARRL